MFRREVRASYGECAWLSGRAWEFGRFETIQTANYACHIARGIVGNGSADMKVNILNVELAKMAIDAGLKVVYFCC